MIIHIWHSIFFALNSSLSTGNFNVYCITSSYMCDIFYFFQVLFHFRLAPGIESLSSYLFFLGSIHYGVPRLLEVHIRFMAFSMAICVFQLPHGQTWSGRLSQLETCITAHLWMLSLVISQVVLVGIQVPCVEVLSLSLFLWLVCLSQIIRCF